LSHLQNIISSPLPFPVHIYIVAFENFGLPNGRNRLERASGWRTHKRRVIDRLSIQGGERMKRKPISLMKSTSMATGGRFFLKIFSQTLKREIFLENKKDRHLDGRLIYVSLSCNNRCTVSPSKSVPPARSRKSVLLLKRPW
jgi:hypothetical protein